MKAMKKEGEAFHYLSQMFPRITDDKIKEGSFVGPQITYVITDKWFKYLLVGSEKIVWKVSQDVVENFLGNNRALKYI